jgi:hypothetical protein
MALDSDQVSGGFEKSFEGNSAVVALDRISTLV